MATCPLCSLLDTEQTVLRALASNPRRTRTRSRWHQVRQRIDTVRRFMLECGGTPDMLDHIAWTH